MAAGEVRAAVSLKFGKRDAQKMAEVLEPLYSEWGDRIKVLKKELKSLDDLDPEAMKREVEMAELEEWRANVEEMALDALEGAEQIIAGKAKFTVVGQVKQPDNKGDKIALGWYATEKQALDDAVRLCYSTQTHEEHRAWVLPIFHGTPNDYYKSRKEERKAEAAADSSYRERELLRRQKWLEEHPGEPLPLDWTVEVAFEAQTDECDACKGMGRIPKAQVTRREDLDRVWH